MGGVVSPAGLEEVLGDLRTQGKLSVASEHRKALGAREIV